jgi:hypothetical protein
MCIMDYYIIAPIVLSNIGIQLLYLYVRHLYSELNPSPHIISS